LLYDGVCALCNAAVAFVLKRDRSRAARFASLQGDTAAAAIENHPELGGIDSMIWIDASGRTFTRAEAAAAIGLYLGGRWAALAALARIVPLPVRNAVYDLVARWRYRIFGRYDACPLPPAGQEKRFLP
jgi:predicted DCC family thiol-disulfide oxidoreductase YuxK